MRHRRPTSTPTETTRLSPADDYFDVLTIEEFRHAVTEKLLHITPPLIGPADSQRAKQL